MKILLFLSFLIPASVTFAAPFYGKIIPFTQPDGGIVDVKLLGDEFYMRAEGLDNYTLVRDKKTNWICYAKLSEDGSELISSGIVYHGRLGVMSSLKSNLSIAQHLDIDQTEKLKIIADNKHQLNKNLIQGKQIRSSNTPIVGNIKGLCIVVDFSDAPRTVPINEFNDFCNKTDYSNYGNNGSLRKFYSDISGGLVDYQNVVLGYYRAPLTFAEYDKMPYARGAGEILKWVLNQINSEGFDFSTLSTNPDKSIVAINLMFTGNPQIWSQGMWWHQGYLPDFSADGVHSGMYNCSPANAPLILSTVAHENGHMIANWPDTYKYSTTNGPDGIGTFDLMCNYGNQYNPVPPNPLFRIDAGWGKIVDITNYNGVINDAANSLTCYKYQINNSKEFFLIESRRKKGRSIYIPDEGLTIWHIDRSGDNQSTHHQVYLVHANNNVNDHSNACFHAGYNSDFSSATVPGSGFYNGDPSGLQIKDISGISDTMTYHVGVTAATPALWISYQKISDDNNQNGLLEPGESGNLNILVGNNGQKISGNTSLVCTASGSTASYVTINTPTINTGIINVSQSTNFKHNVSIQAGTPIGTKIDLRFTLSDGINSTFLTSTFIIGKQIIMSDQKISLCSAMFYDNGGPFSNYDNMTDDTITFSPASPYLPVKVEFLEFELESDQNCNYDYMKIFNGGSVSSPLIGTYCGTNSPGTIISADPSGKLTFVFHSDVGWRFSGWTARVTVDPLLSGTGTITGTSSVCQGQNAVLYSVPVIPAATSYIWTLPPGATGSGTSNSIFVNFGGSAASGSISVKGRNDCGDGAVSVLPVMVKPVPPTPIITLTGNMLHSNAAIGNQWYNLSGAISGETSQDFTPKSSGNYYVMVTQNGCPSNPSNQLNFSRTGLGKVDSDNQIRVYPNPAVSEFIIESEGNTKKTDFVILNTEGQVIFNGNLINKATIQTSGYSPGLYLIRFSTEKGTEFRKIMKL